MQRSRLAPVSPKKRKRSGKVGKCGIVRLSGDDLQALRHACFERDDYECRACQKTVYCACGVDALHDNRFKIKADHFFFPDGLISHRAEMAHIRTKRNNGDTLDNVRTLCPDCHRREHNPESVPGKRGL